MTTMNEVEPRLQWFVGEMRDKLAVAKNQRKTDWREVDPRSLRSMLADEVDELGLAMWAFMLDPSEVHRRAVIRECADVANLAMMLGDWHQTWTTGRNPFVRRGGRSVDSDSKSDGRHPVPGASEFAGSGEDLPHQPGRLSPVAPPTSPEVTER